MALISLRARYRNGVLEPLDDIDLTEDEEVLLTFAGQTVRPATDHRVGMIVDKLWSGDSEPWRQ